jgi:hypothetical protein
MPNMPGFSDNDPMEFKGHLPEHPWAEVKSGHRGDGPSGEINRHRGLKFLGKGALIGGKASLTAATAATTAMGMKTGVVAVAAVATGTATAASMATGIGLAAATAALTIGQSAVSANSLRKTIGHIDGLTDIQRKVSLGMYPVTECEPINAKDAVVYHQFIADKVLPYIIRQKKLKAAKKGVGIVPGAIFVTGLYAAGRKMTTGVGLKRTFYANVLGEHLITCNCKLAKAIVENLMGSATDMVQLMLMDLSAVTPILAPKMKSV